MVSFREAVLDKMFVCCALTIVYSIYNMVGRSIASIYDLGGIFTSGRINRLWTCTRRSPARLVGRVPPAEAVDGEIFIASAWASSNLGHAYLTSRCSHLLVSRLYTDRSIVNFWERGRGRTYYGGRSTASGGLGAYN